MLAVEPDYSSGFAPPIPEANRLEAMNAKFTRTISMNLYSYDYIPINIDMHSHLISKSL